MKQTRIVLLALLISTAASGQEAASAGAPADRVYGGPSQFVAVNGFRLNLYCMGRGSPTVVFDSGWAEPKPLPALQSRPGQPQRTCAQQFFRGLPEAAWSPELSAKLLPIAETKVAMYDAYLSEMEQMAWDEGYLQHHRRSLGSRPIRVLTSGNHGVGHLEMKPADTPDHVKYERQTTLAQARWLALSTNARQIFACRSSEYIQFEEPETVINAIREVYDQARRPVVAHGD